MSSLLTPGKTLVGVNADYSMLKQLKQLAKKTELKRSRICLHSSENALIQEMIIAVCKESLITPHRQLDKNKSYLIIEGDLNVIFYDNSGNIIEKTEMSAKKNEKIFAYRFDAGIWHTIIPLSDMVVFKETIDGPYIKENTEYADWSK